MVSLLLVLERERERGEHRGVRVVSLLLVLERERGGTQGRESGLTFTSFRERERGGHRGERVVSLLLVLEREREREREREKDTGDRERGFFSRLYTHTLTDLVWMTV